MCRRTEPPTRGLLDAAKPLSDREIHVLASAIGVIENQRLRSKIANDVWMTLREYDKALTDGPQSARWFALSRADQMVDF
jgi:DNA-binding phage protein